MMWQRVGEVLAAAASQQPGVSRILLLREESSPELGNVQQDIMEAAFRKEIAKEKKFPGEISVALIPAVPPPKIIPAESVRPEKLPASLLNSTLQKQGPASLVISLVGAPTGDPPSANAWPPVICFSPEGGSNLSQRIRSGVVAAAVAPRRTDPKSGETDWFELRYALFTKADIGD